MRGAFSKPCRRSTRPRGRAGVALLLALGFVALLSLLTAGLLATLRTRLLEGERRAQRASLRADADSALAVMRSRLAAFESDANGMSLNTEDLARLATDPLAGWTPRDGAIVTVRLRDESGLFPLNTVNVTATAKLFEDLGVPTERAASLADSLADWVDADDSARLNGAESEAYGVPGAPANRPLRSFSELRRVRGFDEVFFGPDGSPNELGRELASVTTLLGDGDKPNVNGAPEAVLRVLAVRTGVDVGAVLAFRSPLDYPDERTHRGVFRNAGDLTQVDAPSAFGGRVSYASRGIRVVVTVEKGDLRHVTDALIAPSSGNSASPVMVSRRVDESFLADADGEFVSGGTGETAVR